MTEQAQKHSVVDVIVLTIAAGGALFLLGAGAWIIGNPQIAGNDPFAGIASMTGGAFALVYVFAKATRRL